MTDIARLALEVDATSVKSAGVELDRMTRSARNAERNMAASATRFVDSLKRQADTIGMTTSQVRSYEAAQLKLNSAQRASVDASIKAIEAHERAQEAASKNVDVLSSLQSRLVGIATAYLSFSTAMSSARAVVDATLDIQKFESALNAGLGSVTAADDAMKFLRETAQDLGLDLRSSIPEFAKLAAATKSTALEGQATRDIFIAISNATSALGLSSAEASGAILAIQQIVSKGKVSMEELSQQLGERLPGALRIAAQAMGMTTAELVDMVSKGRVLPEDLLPKLADGLNTTFGAAAQEQAKGLNAQINRFNNALFDMQVAIGKTGLIDFLTSGIELATRLANAMSSAFGNVQTDPLEKQRQAVQDLRAEIDDIYETRRVSLAGSLHTMLPFTTTNKELHELEARYESAVEVLGRMEAASRRVVNTNNAVSSSVVTLTAEEEKRGKEIEKSVISPLEKLTATQSELDELLKKGGITQEVYNRALSKAREEYAKSTKAKKEQLSESQRFVSALQKEVRELGKSRTEILRMEAARVGASKATAADIDLLEREEERLKILREEQEEWNQAKRESESIINQLLTPQEKLIQQYERMQELAGMNLLSDDQMLQSLTKMQSELFRVGETGRNSFGNLDQFAVQAARNIQTAFADALSGIGGGMQDMLSGLGNSLKRLLAEFAAMKITQSLGIGSLFGVGSSAAMASSGGSGGLDILSVANLGSTVASAFSTGLGTTGLVGSAVTSLGQAFGSSAITAFGQGMSGTAFASANAAAGTMGSAFASVAGPAIALFAVDQIGRLLAGNKSTGTFVDSVPVIGGFAGALFGRGPMKQRETDMAFRITGDEIYEGATSTRFRAKGGLFRSNKNKHVITDFEDAANRELSDLIEGSTKGFASVLREAARNLSLDIERINQFNEVFTLQSPVGEWFSEEQIAGVIADIGERMSNQLLPGLEQFARGGETAFQTISRLNSEFSVLADASLILGRSVAESRAMVSALSFDQRSGFIEAAGGMDALAQKAQFFADNFLDDAERLQPAIEMLDEQMAALGLSSALTKEQFKDLVQSYGQFGGISDELLHSLLNIAPLFARVKDGLAALNPALDESANAARALAAAEQLIIDKRSALTAAYQREHAELSRIADRFSSLAMNLRNASDQLALSELSPLTPEQRLAEARSQVQRDWDAGIAGDEAAQNRFAESIRNFVQASQVFNASSAEFVADYEWAQGMLNSGAIAAESAADIARRELSYLESSVSHLTNISTDVGSIESLMRELVDATLHGPGNAGISGDMIREFLSAPGRTPQETVQAIVQHGVSGKQISDALKVDPSTINQAVAQHFSITDKQIRDYVYTPGRTEQEIYQAAISNGISSARLAGAIGMPQSEILEIAKRNGWAAFERGTDLIPRTGFALLHKGEAVTPATHMEKMAAEIRELKEIVAGLLREISHKTGSVVGAVLESSKTNARMIIENNQDMAKSLAWREQTRAHMR